MNKTQKKIAVGAGITALAAAAAAGTYFFAGKRGAKNRAKVSKWADAAKQDVVKQLRGVKQVSKDSYNAAVDAVMGNYKKLQKIKPAEVVALASELKGHWNNISRELQTAGKKIAPVKAVKKAVKTVLKKTAAKKPVKSSAGKKPAKKKARR